MRILLFVLSTSTFLGVGSIVGQDPVKVAPESYKVLLENEQVRVLKGCLNPMHSHGYRVIYELTDHTSRFTCSAAPPVERSGSSAGEVKWGTPVTHSEENIGQTDGCALIVELKQPQTPHSRQP